MGLSFTIAAGPSQRSHSLVRVPRNSWPYFAVSVSRFPQPRGPGPRINIPREQGCPVIPPGAGFLFRRHLRLAGLTVEVYIYNTQLYKCMSCKIELIHFQEEEAGTDTLTDTFCAVILSLRTSLAKQVFPGFMLVTLVYSNWFGTLSIIRWRRCVLDV
jgi:hypothetical protein